jgi:hypothetical protein
MRQVEVRHVAGERGRIGQAGAGVLGREARDRDGLVHGRGDRVPGQVAGRRRALALADVGGDAHAAVALVLERLDLAEPHRDRQTGVDADADVGLGRAGAAGFIERAFDQGGEIGVAERVLRHGVLHRDRGAHSRLG